MVDNPHDSTGNLFTPAGQQKDRIAIRKRRIFSRIEVLPFMHIQGWNPCVVIGMDFLWQINKLLQFAAVDYRKDF